MGISSHLPGVKEVVARAEEQSRHVALPILQQRGYEPVNPEE